MDSLCCVQAPQPRQRITLPELNYDVLLKILFHLNTRDALHLSATTRSLRQIAIDQACVSVSISLPKNVPKACTFLLSDIPNRAHRLRQLDIHLQWVQLEQLAIQVARPLCNLLRECKNLQSLAFLPAPLLYQEHRACFELRMALIHLSRLTRLRLDGITTYQSLDTLVHVQSRPTVLEIGLTQQSSRRRITWSDLLWAIDNLSSTRTLSVDFHGQNLPSLPQARTRVRGMMPLIDKLCLRNCAVDVAMLLRLFPNVRSLYHYSANNDPIIYRWSATQRRLDYLETNTYRLPGWNVQIPVRHMRYRGNPTLHHVAVLQLLKRISPSAISLVSDDSFIEERRRGFWRELGHAVPHLQCLDLKWRTTSVDPVAGFFWWMVCVFV